MCSKPWFFRVLFLAVKNSKLSPVHTLRMVYLQSACEQLAMANFEMFTIACDGNLNVRKCSPMML